MPFVNTKTITANYAFANIRLLVNLHYIVVAAAGMMPMTHTVYWGCACNSMHEHKDRMQMVLAPNLPLQGVSKKVAPPNTFWNSFRGILF